MATVVRFIPSNDSKDGKFAIKTLRGTSNKFVQRLVLLKEFRISMKYCKSIIIT